jgi:pectate lyase
MRVTKIASNRQYLLAGVLVLAISLVGTGCLERVEAQSGEPDLEFTEALATAFKNADPSVKRRIVSALKDIGEPAVPILTDALHDPSRDVRRDAADALGDIGKPVTVIALLTASVVNAQQLAFPSAEGYGKYTKGGRGGVVYEVTNLNDDGPGSLRAAVESSGPRTVVFRVSGTITLESPLRIKNPYITIAGQTAPGDGICLRKHPLLIDASEVVVRHIRIRLGDESGVDTDAVSSRYNKNIIIDHVSASWSIDETMSIYHCENVTVQWCLVSESLYKSNHVKGAHGYGGIWGSNHSTYHHNLLAHHSSRNPRFASGCGHTDYRNNVVYNWGYNSAYGGEKHQPGNSKFDFSVINVVANYYKPGPSTIPGEVTHRIVNPSSRDKADDFGKWYIADNVVHGNVTVTENNWDGGVQAKHGSTYVAGLKLDQPFESMPINQQTAEEAYHYVLENVGATLPKRDEVDARIVAETRGGYATYEGNTYEQDREVLDPSKKSGIIDSQTDVGGWPELRSTTAPTDTDHDGMPDDWETKNDLDPNNATDGNTVASDGYTMLEKYLNSIESNQMTPQ